MPASAAISSSSAIVMPPEFGADGSSCWSSVARLRMRPISSSPYTRGSFCGSVVEAWESSVMEVSESVDP